MRSLKDIRESKVPGTPKKMNMKKLFRRNQIIITTLAVMIAAAGWRFVFYAAAVCMCASALVFRQGFKMVEVYSADHGDGDERGNAAVYEKKGERRKEAENGPCHLQSF
jgi:hypothetical protein